MLEPHTRLIFFGGVSFGNMWGFFQVGTAGLGKYHTGGYGWIGVYRVNGAATAFTVL